MTSYLWFFFKIYDWKPRIKMSSLYDVFLKLLRMYLTFWDQNIIEFLVNARNQYEHKIAKSNPLLKYHYYFSDSFQPYKIITTYNMCLIQKANSGN